MTKLLLSPDNPEGWNLEDPFLAGVQNWYPGSSMNYVPAAALALMGPDRRDLATQRRVQSGQWACLYVRIDSTPPTLDIEGWTTQGLAHGVLRLLIPLDQNDTLAPHRDFARSPK